MIVGRYICERCGKDCTPPSHLWGFGLMIRGALNPSQQKELEEIKSIFGKNEFVWCWSCVAQIFGVKTLTEKNEMETINESPASTRFSPKNKVNKEIKNGNQ